MVGHTRDEGYEVLRVCLCVFFEQRSETERQLYLSLLLVKMGCAIYRGRTFYLHHER